MLPNAYRVPDGGLAAPSTLPGAPTQWPRVALLVFAAYYLGAHLGLALTFEPLPVSVLWPCNAILFASMLLLPAEAWGLVVAAALPAHLLSELMGGIPLAMALCWYASNVAEALVGACLVRLLWGASSPFAAPRGVWMFLVACIVSAAVSSFLDSAFVVLNAWGGESYWTVWRSRILSNATADLVIIPAIVTWASIRWDAGPNRARIDEAAALYCGLAGIALLAFNTDLVPRTPAAQVGLPAPLLLWAALRLGPAGASAAFTFVAVVTIWGAGHGIGALAGGGPIENARSVQLYLLCMGPTLLFLSAAIQQMRRSVDSLRNSDRRFMLALQATRDVVYERNMESGRLWWSKDGRSHLGYSHDTDLDDFEALEEAIHPDDRARAADARAAAVASGAAVWETLFRVRRPNGTYLQVHEQGFVERDGDGRPTQMVGTLKDITERLDAEERAHELSRQSQRTSMGEFAAIVAHEVRQPMGAILLNVDAANMLLATGRAYPDEIRSILDAIRRDDLRATEILAHIRDFANSGEVDAAPCDMNALVGTVLLLAAPAARRHGLQLRALCSDIPPVRGDRVHLQEVLLNLVLNAIDAMRAPSSPVREVRISTAASSNGMVEVSVRDWGCGIPPENLEQVFTSFFTTKADGMGLGLSIARSLVLAHGGRISAQNNADGGATLRFTVPAQEA